MALCYVADAVSRFLIGGAQVSSASDFQWLSHLRFYWTPGEADVFRKLGIRMANAHFYYGFE